MYINYRQLTTFSTAVFLIKREPWPGFPGHVMVNPGIESTQACDKCNSTLSYDKLLHQTERSP